MSENIPIEQLPLNLPEELLLTNMLAYHALRLGYRSDMQACTASISYDSPDPISTFSLGIEDAPAQKRRFWSRKQGYGEYGALKGQSELHGSGNRSYTARVYSFGEINVERMGTDEVTSKDVPLGMYALDGADMVRIGRPDLGKAERRCLRSTSYLPYLGRFVLRQDRFERDGRTAKRATRASAEELQTLHDHIGGGNCMCRLLVRLDHYGPVATLDPKKWQRYDLVPC